MTNQLTQQQVQDLLHYDPATGFFVWRVKPCKNLPAGTLAGSTNDEGYRVLRLGGKLQKAHRVAWLYVHGEWPSMCIDHINGIRGDNRIANLRCVTHRANMENQRSAHANSTTRLLGVSKRGERYVARIRMDGQLRYLGTFATGEEASLAYLAEKRRIHAACSI